jgi:hypothetical protein
MLAARAAFVVTYVRAAVCAASSCAAALLANEAELVGTAAAAVVVVVVVAVDDELAVVVVATLSSSAASCSATDDAMTADAGAMTGGSVSTTICVIAARTTRRTRREYNGDTMLVSVRSCASNNAFATDCQVASATSIDSIASPSGRSSTTGAHCNIWRTYCCRSAVALANIRSSHGRCSKRLRRCAAYSNDELRDTHCCAIARHARSSTAYNTCNRLSSSHGN